MRHLLISSVFLPLLLCAGPLTAAAATSMLSGVLDAAQPTARRVFSDFCTSPAAGHQDTAFTVTAGGEYLFFDAFRDLAEYGAPPISVRIYEHAFDPANPALNLVAGEPESWQAPRVMLRTGTEYRLVVQHACKPAEGAWAVGFDGPGEVRSDLRVQPPAFTSGSFADADPTATRVSCGEVYTRGRYKQFGPVQVSSTGTYYFAQTLFAINDASLASVCLEVYTAPFNPSAPNAFHRASLAGHGTVELKTGQDYYFVVQAYSGLGQGKYHFVLAPSAPFRINAGLADAWYNPETPGQGVFVDVFDKRNTLFIGWFTYGAGAQPDPGTGQAWMTALGPFAGTRAELDLYWTTRPATAPNARPEQFNDGTVSLDFFDCRSGRLRYAWGGTADQPAYQGEFPIRRVRDDSVSLCESQYAGPASPGRL